MRPVPLHDDLLVTNHVKCGNAMQRSE